MAYTSVDAQMEIFKILAQKVNCQEFITSFVTVKEKRISIVNGYVPTTVLPQANQINPAVAWQKCIKVGDHVEMTGTIGRSSTGQPTVFVFDLSIVGQIGRTAG